MRKERARSASCWLGRNDVTHLHVPDGVLPWALWAPAFGLALLLLALSAFASRRTAPREIAARGTLGALALAAMSLELPLGPLDYHLSLLGPVGALLGAAGAYEALFVVSAFLAFAGHGGITVIGLNALVLGAGAAVARPIYRLGARWGAGPGLAVAAAASQAVAGALWVAVMLVALHAGIARASVALPWVGGLVLGLWVGGIAIESVVAFAIGRFVARVRPELLPPAWGAPAPPAPSVPTGAAA